MRIRSICLFIFAFASLLAAFSVSYAQVASCPENLVCITREAALKALADSDKVKSLSVELKAKDQAIDDLKVELNKMRVEFARASGELSGLKQNAVQDRAIIEILIKYARPKKFGLINF